MPRALTTLDAFNAVAEPRRRRVLEVLAGGERPVNDLVAALGWAQPDVSKHLGVLKKVGLVSDRRQGRQRMYRMNPEHLKPIYEWVKGFERFWEHHLDRIQERAERAARRASGEPSPQQRERGSR